MRNFAAFVSLSSQATYSRVSVANSVLFAAFCPAAAGTLA
jgi:hypothetical protein